MTAFAVLPLESYSSCSTVGKDQDRATWLTCFHWALSQSSLWSPYESLQRRTCEGVLTLTCPWNPGVLCTKAHAHLAFYTQLKMPASPLYAEAHYLVLLQMSKCSCLTSSGCLSYLVFLASWLLYNFSSDWLWKTVCFYRLFGFILLRLRQCSCQISTV